MYKRQAPSLQIGTLTGFPSNAVMSLSFLQAPSCYWVSLQYSRHQVLLSIVTRFPFSSVMSMGFPFSAVMSMGFPFSTAMSLGSLQNWHVTVSNQHCHVSGFPFCTVMSLGFPSLLFPCSAVMTVSSMWYCHVTGFPPFLLSLGFPPVLSCH